MRRIVLAFAVIAGLLTAPTQSIAAPNGPAVSGSGLYIVQFQPNVNAASQASIARGMGFSIERQFEAAINGFAAKMNDAQVKALQNNPNVVSVEPDYVAQAFGTQGTSTSPAPWGLDRIDQNSSALDKKFNYPDSAGAGVDVYVFDTGLVPFSEFTTDGTSRVKPGFNAMGDTRGTTDCNGHGTHVSGTIASNTYGVAKKAAIVPVRVLGCTGSGSTVQILTAIDWVIKTHPNGSDTNDFGLTGYSQKAVANMSLGFSAVVSAMDNAVDNLAKDGVLLVAAAGNDGFDANGNSPGRAPIALTVGATDKSDVKPWWSNFGSKVDLFAPGVDIQSINYKTGGVTLMSGTSMASPHAAGVAAVILGAASTTSNNYAAVDALANQVVAATASNSVTNSAYSSWGSGSPRKSLYLPAALTTFSATGSATSAQVTPTVTLGVTATSTSKGKATISWTPLTLITSQTLYVYTVDSSNAPTALVASYSLGTTTSSVTIQGLSSGAKYRFGVSGNNSSGSGEIGLSTTVTIASR